MTLRTKPPFRADQVGSLLRSAAIKDARIKHEAGDIGDDKLKAVEDAEIKRIVAKQEELGLKAVTDGEYRRAWWHFDFLAGLQGVEVIKTGAGIQFQGKKSIAQTLEISGKLGFSDHPMLRHFKYLKDTASAMPKMTIPSPSVLHFRQEEETRRKTYPDIEEFWADLGNTYADAVRGFYAAGCRYLQLDDTIWAYLCSDDEVEKAKGRGLDTVGLQDRYATAINTALAAKPDDMVVTMHVCRGNFRSTWISEGGYEPVAETLLGTLNLDGYFLEYDTERAGGFEPLRFLSQAEKGGDKMVVLGLVTSKFGELETKDDIKARIDEATKYVALEQLCVSPQCGFASTEEGNVLAEDEQWAKLSRVVAVADEVWG